MWFLDFVLSLLLSATCAYGLYRTWLWARENFNLGHIQLQEFQRREYTAVPDISEPTNSSGERN